MPWYAVVEKATGRLESVGTVVASPLPSSLEALQLAGEPDASQVWDQASRSFKPRPAVVMVDRLTDLDADPALSTVWSRLTVAQKAALRDRLGLLLGPRRYRQQSEGVNLE